MRRLLLLLACLPGLLLPFYAGVAAEGQNIFTEGSMDEFTPSYDIWTGVDDDGNLRVPVGYYPIVSGGGQLGFTAVPPGVAVCDSGNGVMDIVVADSEGHLWYYANNGTTKEPKFDIGLPLPFLISAAALAIQLEDFDGDGRPDLLVGDGLGHLYLIPNSGDRTPKFISPERPEGMELKTRRDGELWCNFLVPAYAAWCDAQRKDLLMGDGTYASDNVYYLKNRNMSGKPQFEDPIIVIEGGGREQLSICPWYRTPGAKPDLLVGDRTGKVTLYTNASGKDDKVPRFKDPQPILLGSEDGFGAMARFAVADLNGDGVPDVIFTQQDGSIQVAYNKGSAAAPKFDHANPLTGPPSRKMARPNRWSLGAHGRQFVPPGSFFHQLTVVGADPTEKETYEKDFALPEKSVEKHALKFSFAEPPSKFASTYPTPTNGDGSEIYRVRYAPDGTNPLNYPLMSNTRYEISFDMKGGGFQSVTFVLFGQLYGGFKGDAYAHVSLGFHENLSLGNDWHHFHFPFNFTSKGPPAQAGFSIGFESIGRGAYYLTNFTIQEVK